ncbi:MAG: signal peptide peptidase SppA [Pseudomonadota bacterium]
MSMSYDQLIDRRRLRRKVTFWRVAALILLALTLIAVVMASGVTKRLADTSSPHIARLEISGFIREDRKLLKLIEKIKKSDEVKGVILTINTPGGATVGGESIFEAVRELAEKKPVVASVGTLAASAGYMIASASDHIVARRSSIVGSIGVIFQYPDASVVLDKIGFAMKEIKSAPLKAEPSPFHEAPPEARAMIQRLVDDSFNWFVDLVTDRRPLNRDEVLKLADGSVFTGSQGLANKLVDELGGEKVARAWLSKEKGLKTELKTIQWSVPREESGLPFGAASLMRFAEKLGYGSSAKELLIIQKYMNERVFLDGLVSIWQVSPLRKNSTEGVIR